MLTLANTLNNWTGNTILLARTNVNGDMFNVLISSNSEVIPNGFGYGNVIMQVSNVANAAIVGWDLNGFSETINGLSAPGARLDGFGHANIGGYTHKGAVPTALIFNGNTNSPSTLIIGDNNQSGLFGGVISTNSFGAEGTNSAANNPGGISPYQLPIGTIGVTKIGAGVETFTNINTYTGDTVISNGVLQMATLGAIPNSTVYIDGGALDVSPIGGYIFGNSQVVNALGGTLFVSTATGNGSFNSTNGTLEVSVPSGDGSGIGTPNLTASTVNFGGLTNVIQVANIPLLAVYPDVYPVIHYNSALHGNLSNVGLSLPGGGFPPYAGFLSNDTASSTIYLVLTGGPITPLLTWVGYSSGALNSTWDFVASDWTNIPAHTASSYSDGSLVIFNDFGRTNVLNLNASDVLPAGVTFANTNINYTLIGSYGIRGTNAITKLGTGTVIIDNSGTNDFSGGLTISAGTVQVGNGDANGSIGSGTIGNSGTLVFNRNNNTLVVGNNITGTGGLTVNGTNSTVTVSGNNSYTGPVSVTFSNVFKAGSTTALGATNTGTTIANGAALDVNGKNLGAEQITVGGLGLLSGGVTNGGAIYNSSPVTASPAVAFVTLTGDTIFGAPAGGAVNSNRWDLRAPGGTTGDPSTAKLSTSGNAYNLTKVGNNFIGIVSATVDPALNNVDVQAGTLDFEGNTTGLGNPAGTLTVENGATLTLYSATNQLNKQIALQGGSTVMSANGNNNTVIGPISTTVGASSTVTLNAASGTTLTLSGGMSGPAEVDKTGTNSTVILSGLDNRNADTAIIDGTLILNGIHSNTGNNLFAHVPNGAGHVVLGGNGTNAGTVYADESCSRVRAVRPARLGRGIILGADAGSPVTTFELTTAMTVGSGVNDLLNVTVDFEGDSTPVLIHPLAPLSAGPYILVNGGSIGSPFSGAQIDPVFSPSRYQFSLNQVGNQEQLTVTRGPSTLEWNGAAGNGVWDVTNSFNWYNMGNATNDYFAQLDKVLLDNSIIASGGTNVITLTDQHRCSRRPSRSIRRRIILSPGRAASRARLTITKTNSSVLQIDTANTFSGTRDHLGRHADGQQRRALGVPTMWSMVTNSGTLDVGGPIVCGQRNPISSVVKLVDISGCGVNNSKVVIINSSANTQENADAEHDC